MGLTEVTEYFARDSLESLAIERHALQARLEVLRRRGVGARALAAEVQEALAGIADREARLLLAGDPPPTWTSLLRVPAAPAPGWDRACQIALERSAAYEWHCAFHLVGNHPITYQRQVGLKLVRGCDLLTRKVEGVLEELLRVWLPTAPLHEATGTAPVKSLRLVTRRPGSYYLAVHELRGVYECRRWAEDGSVVLHAAPRLGCLLDYAAQHCPLLTSRDFRPASPERSPLQ